MERPFPAYQRDEPYIFVSYAHEDAEVVYPEIQWLKDQGFNIWYDEGIAPGHEWHQELADRIEDASQFLYFISPQSAESEHCQREVHYAVEHGKQLLAVHLQETDLPSGLELSLGSTQAILRHELSDLDYRISLLRATSAHTERGIGAAPAPAKSMPRRTFGLLLAVGLVCLITAGTVVSTLMSVLRTAVTSAPAHLERFVIEPAEGTVAPGAFNQSLAISEDGRTVVFTGVRGGRVQLYARRLAELEPAVIMGTDVEVLNSRGPGNFVLSPDGNWVAFVDGDRNRIKKVRLAGGQPVTVCEIKSDAFLGMTWGSNGTIVFANYAYRGLMQVPESGGTPEPLTEPPAGQSYYIYHPYFLPDANGLLFTRLGGEGDAPVAQIVLLSLKTGEQRVLIEGDSPQIARSGHLLFHRDGAIWAAPFDLDALEIGGAAVPVLEGVMAPLDRAHYSVSADGTLVYRTGTWTLFPDSSLVWVSRDGVEEALGIGPRSFAEPRLSPRGEQIALIIVDPDRGQDLWIYSIEQKTLSRLTFDAVPKAYPLWSADGTHVVYRTMGPVDSSGIYRKAADGTGAVEQLTSARNVHKPGAWSNDGEVLLFGQGGDGGYDTWEVNLANDSTPRPLWETKFNERYIALSPDGKWLAYQSNETGEPQIYVRPYPDVDSGRWQVSPEFGELPRWGPTGQEIFYLGQSRMMVVSVETDPSFRPGTPAALFDATVYQAWYDVAPDGDRFLMVKPERDENRSTSRIILVKNWVDELARSVPPD